MLSENPPPGTAGAATEAIDALAHLALLAMAEGHRRYAVAAMHCLEKLLSAPGAGEILPEAYQEAGRQWLEPADPSPHSQ